MAGFNYTEPGTEGDWTTPFQDTATREVMDQAKPGMLTMLANLSRDGAKAAWSVQNLAESFGGKFGAYPGLKGIANALSATDTVNKLNVAASQYESEAAKTPHIPASHPALQRLKGSILRGAPSFVAQTAEYSAALATAGPTGIVGLEAMRGGVTPKSSSEGLDPYEFSYGGATKGGLKGLAYTALPFKVADSLTASIESGVSRRLARGAVSGLLSYRLSGDPATGLMSGALGLVGPSQAAIPRSITARREAEAAISEQVSPGGSGAAEAAAKTMPPGASSGAAEAAAGLPGATPTGERIYSIGLDKFNGVNLKQVVRESALRNEAATPEHAIPRTWQETEAMAQPLVPLIDDGMTLKQVADLGPTRALAGPQMKALGNVLADAGEKSMALKQALAKDPGNVDLMAEFVSHTARLDRLTALKGEGLQEAGRTLNIAKMPLGAGQSAETQLKAAQRMLPRGAPIEDVAKMMLELPDPAQATLFWRALRRSKDAVDFGFDTLHTFWLNALLSGPQSHVMNMGSNALMQVWGLGEEAGKATAGATRSGISQLMGHGPVTDRVYFREIPARMRGWSQAWSDTGEVMRRAYSTGTLPEELGGISGSKVDMGTMSSEWYTAPTRAMAAEDVGAKFLALRGDLLSQATREGIRQGLKGDALKSFSDARAASPTEAMLDNAAEYADVMTFTRDLGGFGEAMRRLAGHGGLDINVGGKQYENVTAPGGRWIVPFMRTMVNIQKEGIARSPFALATPRFWSDVKEGGIARDAAATKMVMGTAATVGFGTWLGGLHMMDRITGAAPSDPAKAAEFYERGKKPYSFLADVPFDDQGPRWINYGRIQPIGTIVGGFVDFINGYTDAQEKEGYGEKTKAAAIGAIKSLRDNQLSQTGFMGALDFTNAVEKPEDFLETWVNGMARSVVPAGIRQVARSMDEPQPGQGGALRRVVTPMDAIQEGLPETPLNPNFNRSKLPQRMGSLTGEPQSYGPSLGGGMLSPMWSSNTNERPLFRVLDETQSKVTPPDKQIELHLKKDDPDRPFLRGLLKRDDLPKDTRTMVEKLLSPQGYSRKLEPADYEAYLGQSGEIAAREVEYKDSHFPRVADRRLNKLFWTGLAPHDQETLLTPAEPGKGLWSRIPRDKSQAEIARIYSESRSAVRESYKAKLIKSLREDLTK